MSATSSFLSGVVVGVMVMTGCASTKAVVEPSVETAPPPIVDQASIQAMGPPPGYMKPENYWVREKIILTSAPEPEAPATPKSAKKRKKSKKTSRN